MRWIHACLIVAAIWLLALEYAKAATETGLASADSFSVPSVHPTAEQLVRDALLAESEGDFDRRAECLQQAVATDPDCAAAHWHLGQVRVGNRWQSVADAEQAALKEGKVARYQKLRNDAGDDAESHLSLAKSAAKLGLAETERFHLLSALEQGVSSSQARTIARKLDLVSIGGTLAPRSQAKQLRVDSQEYREWRRKISALQRDLEQRNEEKRFSAMTEFKQIHDPAAISAIEDLFRESNSETGKLAVDVVAQIPGQKGTDALARFAVFAPTDEVRTAAARALKPRSIFAYAPLLVSGVEFPVDAKLLVHRVGDAVFHSLQVYREGPTGDFSYTNASSSDLEAAHSGRPAANRVAADPSLRRDAAIAERELSANAERLKRNEYIAAALQTATGENIDATASGIWNWWMDYNDVYRPEVKPLDVAVDYHAPSFVFYDCFPAGTPVETATGPIKIERIQPGDCILAQNPESGELAFKPVVSATIRPTGKLIEIRASGEKIRATRGHPFWVDGIGWQMAKELKPGQWLHTVRGPVEIEDAAEVGEAECHVLVVADFHSYFVGQHKFLVHDNNIRQVTTATVPGLAER